MRLSHPAVSVTFAPAAAVPQMRTVACCWSTMPSAKNAGSRISARAVKAKTAAQIIHTIRFIFISGDFYSFTQRTDWPYAALNLIFTFT